MQLASGAAHAGGAVNDILTFIAAYWWLALLFGGAITALLEGVRDFFLAMARHVLEGGQRRHERRLELIRARHGGRLTVGIREDGSEVTVAPFGSRPCSHPFSKIEPVYGVGGDLVARLCSACQEQLPLDPAVREEGP